MPMKSCFTGFLAGFFALALAAGAQTPAQPAPSKPSEKKQDSKDAKAKPKKVWTEDDVGSLRKPSDDYAEQRQAVQAASSAETQTDSPKDEDTQASSSEKTKTAKGVQDPNSPQALERRLNKWEAELQRNEQQLDEARRIMSETTDPDRFEIAKKNVEIFEQNRIEIQNMIQETRAQLEQAKKQSKGGAGPAPAQPEGGNPPPPSPPAF